MSTEALAASLKLPLWRTVGQAYVQWAKNLIELFHACWLWMLVLAPILAIVDWWQAPRAIDMHRAARTDQLLTNPTPLSDTILEIVPFILTSPALASIAVAWHRLLLNGEHAGPRYYLRLDSLVISYALMLAVL
jgi:hypothetical protein